MEADLRYDWSIPTTFYLSRQALVSALGTRGVLQNQPVISSYRHFVAGLLCRIGDDPSERVERVIQQGIIDDQRRQDAHHIAMQPGFD